jgi:hypothetical protein
VGCATGTGDDHLDATAFGLFGVLEQQIRGAVGGNHLHFVGMPSFSSISAVWLRVDQSDLEPMITPTSALIVVPLLSGRPQARQKQQAAGLRGLIVRKMAGRTGRRPRSIPQRCQ